MTQITQSLQGKVALVTGAAGGIGAACVHLLATAGARVMATDIDGEGCQAIAFAEQAHGLDVAGLPAGCL